MASIRTRLARAPRVERTALLEPGSVDMATATEAAIVRLIGRDLPT